MRSVGSRGTWLMTASANKERSTSSWGVTRRMKGKGKRGGEREGGRGRGRGGEGGEVGGGERDSCFFFW